MIDYIVLQQAILLGTLTKRATFSAGRRMLIDVAINSTFAEYFDF